MPEEVSIWIESWEEYNLPDDCTVYSSCLNKVVYLRMPLTKKKVREVGPQRPVVHQERDLLIRLLPKNENPSKYRIEAVIELAQGGSTFIPANPHEIQNFEFDSVSLSNDSGKWNLSPADAQSILSRDIKISFKEGSTLFKKDTLVQIPGGLKLSLYIENDANPYPDMFPPLRTTRRLVFPILENGILHYIYTPFAPFAKARFRDCLSAYKFAKMVSQGSFPSYEMIRELYSMGMFNALLQNVSVVNAGLFWLNNVFCEALITSNNSQLNKILDLMSTMSKLAADLLAQCRNDTSFAISCIEENINIMNCVLKMRSQGELSACKLACRPLDDLIPVNGGIYILKEPVKLTFSKDGSMDGGKDLMNYFHCGVIEYQLVSPKDDGSFVCLCEEVCSQKIRSGTKRESVVDYREALYSISTLSTCKRRRTN